MNSKAGRDAQYFFENRKFVKRLIYDVLVYTLTKCGLPASSLPTTDCDENIYQRTDFLETAGASVLRISLVMRDTWKRMLKSRRSSCGFNKENITEFMTNLLYLNSEGRTCCKISVLELLLALGNEFILFFQLENIEINSNILTTIISDHIAFATGLNQNDPIKPEALFDIIDDISRYTEWITDFISRFALPYGSRDDVSDLFLERVREKYEDDLKKMTDSFRFLPSDLFSALIAENSAEFTSIQRDCQSLEPPNPPMVCEVYALNEDDLKKGIIQHLNLLCHLSSTTTARISEKSAETTSIRRDGQSPEPPNSPIHCEVIALNEDDVKKLVDQHCQFLCHYVTSSSARISEKSTETTSVRRDGQSPQPSNSTMSSEVDTFGYSNFLGNRATHTESRSELLSQNQSKRLEQRIIDEGLKSSANIISLSNERKSLTRQKLPTDSEIEKSPEDSIKSDRKSREILTMERKKSSSCQPTGTENAPGLCSEIKQSSEGSSELVIEQDFGKTGLEVQETFPEIHDAKDKIAKDKKDIGKINGILLFSFIGFAVLATCYKLYTRKRRFK